MLLKLSVQAFVYAALIGLVLFLPAGTWRWPEGWVFIAEIVVGSLGLGFWLMQTNPALLSERMRAPVQADQKSWDKLFVGLIALAFIGWMGLMAVDAKRYGWSDVPLWLKVVGALGPLACYGVTALAFAVNSGASAVVKVGEAQSHLVADTGPYRFVRHPMYSGALLFFVGTPLLLGSCWGLAASPLLGLALGIRAVLEERALFAELPGYADYARRVHSRLIPAVW
jgi:protein-S-isoprenylcysteine O-methyltransferase Ste14